MIATATTTGARLEALNAARHNFHALLDLQEEWIGHRDHEPHDTTWTIHALLLEWIAACEGEEILNSENAR